MEIVDIPITSVQPPDWNPNEMPDDLQERLRNSLRRFGVLVPLVVRQVGPSTYETINGAERLAALRDIRAETIPCIRVPADDVESRLIGQVLNHVAGEDNLGLRAALLRDVLDRYSTQDVVALLPESVESLRGLTELGTSDLANALQQWEAAQAAKLRHLQFQLTDLQKEVVDEALEQIVVGSTTDERNPNRRSNALVALCRAFLENQS